jgi:hypothetical protein
MSQPPPTHLLRVEGVNLASVLDDTDDISTRRGASMMLRQAIIEIEQECFTDEAISAGASEGLFVYQGEDPAAKVEEVASFLRQRYVDLTFVVDSVPLNNSKFKTALERVITANRLRQLGQMTLVAPNQAPGSESACALDRLRPAVNKIKKGQDEEEKLVSASVARRRKFGKEQRQGFYNREMQTDRTLIFTSDLQELSTPGLNQNFANLNGKIALIYLDGNKFGKIKDSCKEAAELRKFDRHIRQLRRDYLRAFIDLARNDLDFANHDQLRIEVLLWGGDEILLAVPAWKGIETLEHFFAFSADWNYAGKPLTHAAGIVFCGHHTPIQRSIRSAYELAEQVKKQLEGTQRNAFDYLVLESIDYPTQSLQKFRQLRYGAAAAQRVTPLQPLGLGIEQGWGELRQAIASALQQLPRGALHELASAWVEACKIDEETTEAADATETSEETPPNPTRFEERLARFREVSPDAAHFLNDHIFPRFGIDQTEPDHPGWLHLIELWDYLAPVNTARGDHQ